MNDFERRISSVDITFSEPGDYLDPFCRDLGITPEYVPKIKEDEWGSINSLSLWFQKIDTQRWTLHIQKTHFKRNKTYLKDLRDFAEMVEALDYVTKVCFR